MRIATDPAPAPPRRYDLVAAGVLVLMAALYFTYAALGSYLQQSKAHSSFVPVEGTIVEASVRSTGSTTAAHGGSFSLHIVYRYSMDGKAYQNDRYFFVGDGWRDAAAVEAVTARLPAGTTIRIYVDAKDPSQAVIDRTKPRPGVLLYLLPFAALGLGVLAYGLRRRTTR